MQNSPIFSKGGRLLYLLHQVEDVTLVPAHPRASGDPAVGARPGAG
jgi:hypothetical protein